MQVWNKKQATAQFVAKYNIPFAMEGDAIDLREMAKNYDYNIIPLEHIYKAIVTVIGPKYLTLNTPYDPSGGATITYPNASTSPRFGYIE
jgi:hypothetical protein